MAVILKKARASGVPKENIENALKKASGGDGKTGQQVTYEIMVGGSIGVIVECLTDNLNRTIHTIRDIVKDNGARFASVAFLFQRKGSVKVLLDTGEDFDASIEDLLDVALAAGIEDFEQSEPSSGTVEIEFMCPPTSLAKVTSAVTKGGLCKELVSSELIYVPNDPSEPPEGELEEKISSLVEGLEDHEDTLRVWTTLD